MNEPSASSELGSPGKVEQKKSPSQNNQEDLQSGNYCTDWWHKNLGASSHT